MVACLMSEWLIPLILGRVKGVGRAGVVGGPWASVETPEGWRARFEGRMRTMPGGEEEAVTDAKSVPKSAHVLPR